MSDGGFHMGLPQQQQFGSFGNFGQNSNPNFGLQQNGNPMSAFNQAGFSGQSQNSPGGFQNFFGNGTGMENLTQGISAFGSLASIYSGFKSMGMAKDQFKFQKNAFNKNFNASATAFNNTQKDRWAAANASASSRGQSFQGMDAWLSGRTIDKTGKKKNDP